MNEVFGLVPGSVYDGSQIDSELLAHLLLEMKHGPVEVKKAGVKAKELGVATTIDHRKNAHLGWLAKRGFSNEEEELKFEGGHLAAIVSTFTLSDEGRAALAEVMS